MRFWHIVLTLVCVTCELVATRENLIVDYQFHLLLPGQAMDVRAEDADDARIAVRRYQRRWRKLGWSYAADPMSDGSLRITRLPDALVGIKQPLERVIMPVDLEQKYIRSLELEMVRVFRKIIDDGVDKAYRLAGLKSEHVADGYIPNSVLRNYCSKLCAFKRHPMGFNTAFNTAFVSLVAQAVFVEFTNGNIQGVKRGANFVDTL